MNSTKTTDPRLAMAWQDIFTYAVDSGIPECRQVCAAWLQVMLLDPAIQAHVRERLAYEKTRLDAAPYIGGRERAMRRGLAAVERFLMEAEAAR
jgi:hypothetical protein